MHSNLDLRPCHIKLRDAGAAVVGLVAAGVAAVVVVVVAEGVALEAASSLPPRHARCARILAHDLRPTPGPVGPASLR